MITTSTALVPWSHRSLSECTPEYSVVLARILTIRSSNWGWLLVSSEIKNPVPWRTAMWNRWMLKERLEGLACIQMAGMERTSWIILRAGIAESTISDDHQKQSFLYILCTEQTCHCHGHTPKDLEVVLSQFSPDRSQHQSSNSFPVPLYIVVV